MARPDNTQQPVQCRLNPALLVLNWLVLVWMVARTIINPWGTFWDIAFLYLVTIAVLYNSISYVIGEEGITLKILGWPYLLRWKNITQVEVFRFYVAIHVADINIWVRLLGTVGGLTFFTGPQFRLYPFHSNYDIMVDTLQQHVKKFTKRE